MIAKYDPKLKDKLLARNCFVFNPKDNGGETVSLLTEFYSNGEEVTSTDGVYVNQNLSLQSYGNSASFTLCGAQFTPNNLRELANQLERQRNLLVGPPKEEQ